MVLSLCHLQKISIKDFKEKFKDINNPALSIKYQFNGKSYKYIIATNKTPCNYGGHRLWWICPKCSKRVGMLYKLGEYGCRKCTSLNYLTQNSQPYQRKLLKLDRIRNKLQWNDELSEILATKPKGMHQSTFDKLLIEYATLEEKLYERSQFSAEI